jgi:hypothetical protein
VKDEDAPPVTLASIEIELEPIGYPLSEKVIWF